MEESKQRVPLDEKLYKRDLEAALSLSLQHSMDKSEEPPTYSIEDEKCQPPVLTHCSVNNSFLEDDTSSNHPPQDSPPVLSNCSVDDRCLGLDQITSEQTPSSAASGQKKISKTRERKKQVLQDENSSSGDEDYKPQNMSESDTDFSDPDEHEDKEFTVKRRAVKKTTRKEKKTIPKAAKKENIPKLPKATQKSAVSKTALKSPGVAQSSPALKRSPITPSTPKLTICSSPAGGRLSKWNPPGLVRSSPTSCQSAPVKSPGQGLRLGLSRLARVKPLHPNAAAQYT
ncbi:hypothetical protein NFI96_022135 [Prochilodus magdalenae]|nr:hypothetical protein NFI96_022135 [Prochilodus magdalenae]